jgi:hypothetical protein
MKQPKASEPKVGCAFPMDGTGNFPAALEFRLGASNFLNRKVEFYLSSLSIIGRLAKIRRDGVVLRWRATPA